MSELWMRVYVDSFMKTWPKSILPLLGILDPWMKIVAHDVTMRNLLPPQTQCLLPTVLTQVATTAASNNNCIL